MNSRWSIPIFIVSFVFALSLVGSSIYICYQRWSTDPKEAFKLISPDSDQRILEQFFETWNISKVFILTSASIILFCGVAQCLSASWILYGKDENIKRRKIFYWMIINGGITIALITCIVVLIYHDPEKEKRIASIRPDMQRGKFSPNNNATSGLVEFLEQGLHVYNSLLGVDVGFLIFSLFLLTCYRRKTENNNNESENSIPIHITPSSPTALENEKINNSAETQT